MKNSELNANTNLKEFAPRIALNGKIYTIDFDSVIDNKYSDDIKSVTHNFLPYRSEDGEILYFDREGIANKYAGRTYDARTKIGKTIREWHRKYFKKDISITGEIL